MTGPVRISAIDPFDDDALGAWHATYDAAARASSPYPTPRWLVEVRAQVRAVDHGERRLLLTGTKGGDVVVAGSLMLPTRDNLATAHVEVSTHPDHRRCGYGSAMLEHLVACCRDEGRSVLLAEADFPTDAPADGAGEEGPTFLTRHGFTFGLGDVMRVVDLPVEVALLDDLAAEAAEHHSGYTLRRFTGPVPEDILPSFADLIGALMTEAPMGEITREPEVFDEDRIRADEAVFAASNRTKFTTVAIDRDGAVAAYSEIAVPEVDPGRAFQWGTLVRRAHRGHRLGLATKAANLRWLQSERPDVTSVITWNAEVNSHMVGINERLGFRPVARSAEFQRVLDA